jgi:transcriptional regulator with XRE-family HTH domain
VRVDGAKLRRERERRLMTLQDVSEKSGVAIATLSRIENGLQQPRIPTVRRLATALGANPEEFIVWDGDEETGKAAPLAA